MIAEGTVDAMTDEGARARRFTIGRRVSAVTTLSSETTTAAPRDLRSGPGTDVLGEGAGMLVVEELRSRQTAGRNVSTWGLGSVRRRTVPSHGVSTPRDARMRKRCVRTARGQSHPL